jgi:predicted Zn-dependent protease
MRIKKSIFHPIALYLTIVLLGGSPAAFAKDDAGKNAVPKEVLGAANEVLRDPDNINAGKNAGRVFEAAHALLKAGDRKGALGYFQRGLQLSPWRLEEQLAYADLLKEDGREKEAVSIAEMVDERAESDEQSIHARKLAGKPPAPPPAAPDAARTNKPWICLVQIGHVNQVVLGETMKKLQDTLGIPVFLHPDTAEVGKPHRSALSRWVRTQISPKIKWDSPPGQAFLRSLGVDTPAEVKPSQLVKALISDLRLGGREEDARGLEENAEFFRAHDQQWDAGVFADYGFRAAEGTPHLEQAMVFGITEADLYSDDNNYVFGTALTGARKGVVSYARYQATFFGEPPDRTRLVSRMHKLLLSTLGSSLNIPRPTDPTSARAYPASLAEHDAKSEYMSEACIAGFEKALGTKLPEAAHKPSGRR